MSELRIPGASHVPGPTVMDVARDRENVLVGDVLGAGEQVEIAQLVLVCHNRGLESQVLERDCAGRLPAGGAGVAFVGFFEPT